MPYTFNPFTSRLDFYEASSGGTVTSVSGTPNRITVTNGTTAAVVDIAATYVGQTSITTLGTVTTGVWQGTAIGPTFGGTGLTTYTTGDTLYASASNVLSKLAVGSNGQVLTLAAGIPSWATPTTGTVTSVSGTTNRITSTGGATPVIDISASYVGQSSITTLGTISTGVWNGTAVDATHGGTAQTSWTAGDLLYASASNTLSKLGIDTDGKVLTLSSGLPSWQSALGFSPVNFSARLTGNISNVTGDGTDYAILYDNVEYNVGGGAYNGATGEYTFPQLGKYLITVTNFIFGGGVADTVFLSSLVVNGSTTFRLMDANPGALGLTTNSEFMQSASFLYEVAGIRNMAVHVIVNGGTKNVGVAGGAQSCIFSLFRVA